MDINNRLLLRVFCQSLKVFHTIGRILMRLLLVLVLESTMMVDLSTSSPLMPTALSSPNEFEGCTERVAESPARFS